MQTQRKESIGLFPGDCLSVFFLNISQVMLFRIMTSHLKKIIFKRPGYGSICSGKSSRLNALEIRTSSPFLGCNMKPTPFREQSRTVQGLDNNCTPITNCHSTLDDVLAQFGDTLQQAQCKLSPHLKKHALYRQNHKRKPV